MKVTFCCNSGANIHSCRKETLDTVDDLGLEEGEWEKLSEDEKMKFVEDWANDRLEIFYTEDEQD